MTTQLNKEQALAFANRKAWEQMSLAKRAAFQLRQERLCMPFDVFHEAVEETMGRPVYTHEFSNPQRLIDEIGGKVEAPSLEELIAMITDVTKFAILIKRLGVTPCALHPTHLIVRSVCHSHTACQSRP